MVTLTRPPQPSPAHVWVESLGKWLRATPIPGSHRSADLVRTRAGASLPGSSVTGTPGLKGTPTAPPPATLGLDEEIVRSVHRWDVDPAARALAEAVVLHLVRDLALPATPPIEWFHRVTPAERGLMQLGGPIPWKTIAMPVAAAGCVHVSQPGTIWLREGLAAAGLVWTLAHEARHVSQFARYGLRGMLQDRAAMEDDAARYAEQVLDWWQQSQ